VGSKENHAKIHRDFHSSLTEDANHAVENQNQQQNQGKSKKSSCSGQSDNPIQNQNRNHTRQSEPAREQAAATPEYSQRQFWIEARMRLQLLRAENEEAVRRELRVGTGPELIRS